MQKFFFYQIISQKGVHTNNCYYNYIFVYTEPARLHYNGEVRL